MALADDVKRGTVLTALTLRYLLATRRVIGMALLAGVPILLAGSLAAARVPSFDILLFQALMVPLFLQVVLIFVTIVNASTLIREEIEDNTLPYLLTRPVSKPAVVAFKYVGYLAAVLVLLVPPLVLAYAITEAYEGVGLSTDADVLSGFLAATALGSAAYGALFLFVSVVVRKPLAVGLLIGFVWESIAGQVPGNVPKFSLIYYLRSVLKGTIEVGPLTQFATDVSAPLAAAVLVGVTVVFLVAAMAVLQASEFRQKA
jgi:ABC-2 type transport system permease protein